MSMFTNSTGIPRAIFLGNTALQSPEKPAALMQGTEHQLHVCAARSRHNCFPLKCGISRDRQDLKRWLVVETEKYRKKDMAYGQGLAGLGSSVVTYL